MLDISRLQFGLAEPACPTPSAMGRSCRWLAILMMTMMVSAGLVSAVVPSSVSAGTVGTINTEGVALMAGIDDQTVVDWLPAGARVDVFWGPENDLYQVRYYDTVGWVWAEFLDVDGGASSADAAGPSNAGGGSDSWAVVTSDTLNVRGDASSSAPIWDSYHVGDWVEVTGDAVNGFVPINYYGDTAWVAVDYLSWDGVPPVGGSGGSVASESAATADRWIDVNASTGLVILYEGDVVYAQYWASIGYDRSGSGFYSTAVGTYHVYRMHQPLEYTAFADAYITDWVGFDQERFNGFHSWSRDADGNLLPNGAGRTGGCVSLPPEQARAVYEFATMGMRVEVHF